MKSFPHLLLLLLLPLGASCSAQSVAEQQDARVIESLKEAGSDISKPHKIDFFLYLPDKAQADVVATEMTRLGYKITAVDEAQDKWQIHATRSMVPQIEAITETTRTLEKLASRHGGEYDGWGAEVVD